MHVTPSANLFSSLRRLLATTLELLGVRLELLGTEVESAKRRLLASLIWAGLGLVLASTGILLACAFVIMLCWDQYRLLSAGAMAALFLAMGAALLRHSWNSLSRPASLFALSLEELARDRAMLNPGEGRHGPP